MQTSINSSECGSDSGFGSSTEHHRGAATEEKLIHSFMLSAVLYVTGRSITKNGSVHKK